MHAAMDICRITGHNIREYRKKCDFSQGELAARAGIDRAYLSQIENGKKNFSILILWQLARVLGVSPAQLLQE